MAESVRGKLFRRPDGLSLAVIAFVALLSFPFLGIGLYEAYESHRVIGAFVHTTGTVVGNSYVTTNHDGTESGAYYPVVEFADRDGNPLRFQDGIGSLPPDYAVGERVALIYNPLNPKDARLYTWKRIWFVPLLFIAIGLLPIVITIAILGIVRRSLRPAEGKGASDRY